LKNNSQFKNMVLSYNHITGTIPQYLTEHIDDIFFDISFNRITGTIENAGSQRDITDDDEDLRLIVNRLSGSIPASFYLHQDISIVSGNVFSCETYEDIPKHDPNRRNAECGSKNLDISIYIFGTTLLFSSVIISIILYFHRSNLLEFRGTYGDRILLLHPKVNLIVKIIRSCIYENLTVAAFICIVGVPLYIILRFYYSTHSYSFRWFISGTMLSGTIPAASVLALWGFLLFYFFQRLLLNKSIFFAPNFQNSLWSNLKGTRKLQLFALGCFCISIPIFCNALFIFLVVQGISYELLFLAQAGLIVSRLLWDGIVSKILLQSITLFDVPIIIKLNILVFSHLMNSIMGPCLAFLFTDPSCFVHLFIPQNEVTSDYTITECLEYLITASGELRDCSLEADITYSTTYYPSFIYNFQCASSLVRTFSPILLMKYSIQILKSLLFSTKLESKFILYLKHIKNLIFTMEPSLLTAQEDMNRSSVDILSLYSTVISLIAHQLECISVIMTFGIICPYVAVSAVFSSLMSFIFGFKKLTNYVDQDSTDKISENLFMKVLSKIEMAIGADAFSISLSHLLLLISMLSAIFIGFFTGDVAADSLKEDNIYMVVFFPFASLSAVGVLCFFLFTWVNHKDARVGRITFYSKHEEF
jgi:hypothetical protein